MKAIELKISRASQIVSRLRASDYEAKRKTKDERIVMNDKFDELAKGLAQSVTRRTALKKFGVGLAGVVLAALGLANKVQAKPGGGHFRCRCGRTNYGCHPKDPDFVTCYYGCVFTCNPF